MADLEGRGASLPSEVRASFEPHFGVELGEVRVHTGDRAAGAARSIGARAFTTGRDIVFGAGQYAPSTAAGRHLLAHELTHVVQQSRSTFPPGPESLRVGPANDAYEQQAEAVANAVTSGRAAGPILSAAPIVQRQLWDDGPEDYRDPPGSPPVKAVTWTGQPKCGTSFCRPFPTRALAEKDRNGLWPFIAGGIATKVSPRVVGIWTEWAFGGDSKVRSLNADFGADFAASPTTATTTVFLMGELEKKLKASRPVVPPFSAVTLNIPALIPAAVAAIDTPGGRHEMKFNVIADIPGNLAGGIGKDQAANPIGANPSSQDDRREALGTVTVVRLPTDDLIAVPSLSYKVTDTVDLCPGDCGASKEMLATIPMSTWEATGVSGDVPYTVDFDANAATIFLPKP